MRTSLRRREAPRLHAIYVVLNEETLFRCSLQSVYPHADRITVITNGDHDWRGRPSERDGTLELLLDPAFDPERKIDVIVTSETNEARARNRAMDFAAPRRTSLRVRRQHELDRPPAKIDYFWIVDADEVYEEWAVERLRDHIARTRKPAYQVAARNYFRLWNNRIDGYGYFTAFIRRDRRLGSLRNPRTTLLGKLLFRIPGVPFERVMWATGTHRVSPEVAYFHHGSYVGPRRRIVTKVQSTGHSHQVSADWVDEKWERWDLAASDFHPVEPTAYSGAVAVDRAELPSEIREFPWPEGYLD